MGLELNIGAGMGTGVDWMQGMQNQMGGRIVYVNANGEFVSGRRLPTTRRRTRIRTISINSTSSINTNNTQRVLQHYRHLRRYTRTLEFDTDVPVCALSGLMWGGAA